MTTPHDPQGGPPPRFSQAQLRDALRGASSGAGAADGGALDSAALIGRARSVRARRRGGILVVGLVASVIAVSVGVVTNGGSTAGQSATSQLQRGAQPGAAQDTTGSKDTAGGSDTAGELPPESGNPLPGSPYAERAPITGTPCPPQRPVPPAAPSGAGSTGALLSFAPDQSWACVYLGDDSAVATELTGDQTVAAVTLLSSGAALSANVACTSDFGPSLRLIVSGAGQRATIDAQAYGCGVVTTGSASRQAKTQVVALLAQLDGDLRPLG